MRYIRENRDLITAGVGVVALFALAFGRGWSRDSSGATHGRIPLRIAYFPNLTHAPALIGISKGTFQSDLPRYSISTRVVNAGPDAMEALLAGEVDFAFVGPSPATNTFLKTSGKALQIVSGVCSGGASLVARTDESISSVRDLDGHSVAVPQFGGTQDVSCRHFLEINGLRAREKGGTVSIIPVANPDILVLFKRKQIDAAWVPEPWATRLVDDGGGKIVVDERQLWPDRQFTTTVLAVRRKFAEAHPDAVKDLVKSEAKTVDWIHSHSLNAQSAANAELKRLTGKEMRSKTLLAAWSRLDFTTDPNLPSILTLAEAAYDEGYLRAKPGNLAGLVAPASQFAESQSTGRGAH